LCRVCTLAIEERLFYQHVSWQLGSRLRIIWTSLSILMATRGKREMVNYMRAAAVGSATRMRAISVLRWWTVPQWRLSALPRYIPASDVESLIAACDATTPVGIRDELPRSFSRCSRNARMGAASSRSIKAQQQLEGPA
jgi:hypothetical protein